jgi:Tfp pilus assembly protein PilF
MRPSRLLPFVVSVLCLNAAGAKQENWVEVRSEHFIVATNSSEKQGRRVADQFERMRSVFQKALPRLQIDPGTPIVVLAIKDEKDFRALEPQAYLAKGQLKLGGLFLHAPDKNYVLMRLDAEGEHPYEVVYHEYTHLLLAKAAEWMPLWLNEGLAEFYQNTDIREKEVALGEPSGVNIMVLRQNRLLPLATLFAVDEKSPYYHEENKGSIFYAESWALTHYIAVKDFQEKAHRLADYAELLAQKVEPATAATRTFGDLKKLEFELEHYVQQGSFSYFKMAASTQIDESTFKARPLTSTDIDALRGDFLAYNERTAEARALLDHVLQEDPKNVSAHETMGFLEFRQRHLEEARKWYAEAVQLDSQSYLAHYYFAAISMTESMAPADEAQVESSLRSAIKLNPSFAPAYDRLAVFLGMRHRDLNEAHMMGLTAVTLEPGNVDYRINVANVLLTMQQAQNAIAVLRAAAKLAKTPQEVQAVDNVLMNAQEYATAQDDATEQQGLMAEAKAGTVSSASAEKTAGDTKVPTLSRRDTFVAAGPHRFLVGVLKDVHCESAGMDLTVNSGGKSLSLHAENYYKIQFTALDFSPSGDLNPCKDLEGRPAKVEYVESADKSTVARVLGVELHK